MKKLFIVAVIALAACNSDTAEVETEQPNTTTYTGIAEPVNIGVNVIGIYPHDTAAYTQGLEIHNGKFYEGTGDFEGSSLRIVDIKSGKVEKKHVMGSPDIFGEGITIFKEKIYQLTWQNHVVNVYDVNNIDKPIKTFQWPEEGWGITNNGTELVISDGSDVLYFVNADDFSVKRSVKVKDNIGPVEQLNELEYIDGAVYANVYQSNHIVKIDPATGNVTGKIILSNMLKQFAPDQIVPNRTDVLNGIAWDSTAKKMYITGKRWPKMFEVVLK